MFRRLLFIFYAIIHSLAGRGKPVTTYVITNRGFSAHSTTPSPVHRLSEVGLRKAIDVLLTAGSFDLLWISNRNDKYTGVVVTTDSGEPLLSTSFRTHTQKSEIRAFNDAMTRLGYSVSEDSSGFNGGFTEQHRETELEIQLPNSTERVLEGVLASLAQLHPDEGATYYVTASRLCDFVGASPGVKFVPEVDPLANIE